MLFLRSLLFSIGSLVALVVIVSTGLLTAPLPYRYRFAYLRRWGQFVIWWLKVTCRIDYQIEGRENIPAQNAVVLCKHQSMWETIAMQSILIPQTWVLKRELMWVPVFGWGMALCKPIAIDRNAGRKALEHVVTQGIERLKEGIWVIIYPEGTRMAPGERGKYGAGGAILASRSGYPVLPVAHNAGEYWGKRQFIKRPGTIKLVFGPVIEPQGKSASQINAATEEWIESTMARISSVPVQKQPPADTRNKD